MHRIKAPCSLSGVSRQPADALFLCLALSSHFLAVLRIENTTTRVCMHRINLRPLPVDGATNGC